MQGSLDIVAKLLANENISVQREQISTACFDIENRVLMLPEWKDITREIDQMLVAHEIGHVLFTPMDFAEALKTRLLFPGAKSYLNILEDARVEKLTKRRYLGLRKTFHTGYQQLYDRNFFGTNNKNLNKLHLLDKINLYFKVGSILTIDFSEEEQAFVDRIKQLENIQETIDLAQELYEYVKTHPREDGEELDVEDGEYGDPADFEILGSGAGNEEEDSDLPITHDNFIEKVNQLSNANIVHQYMDLKRYDFDIICPYNIVAQQVQERAQIQHHDTSLFVQTARQFKQVNQNNVDYLVKEFEMKKAASSYKRSQTSKVGQLDSKKLWSYRVKDDLFKRVTTVKEGKNHGMIFLLDWSGSMRDVIQDTLDQVINLAMFCKQVGIAFQVFAFVNKSVTPESDEFHSKVSYLDLESRGLNVIDVTRNRCGLVELFSHKMSSKDFMLMIGYAKEMIGIRSVYSMGGTPLNEALVFLYDYIEKFQKENKVEKLSFVTLTDGDGTPISQLYYAQATRGGKTVKFFIKDPYTRANVPISRDRASHTHALLTLIKNRYKCKMIGFHIVEHGIRSVLKTHYSDINSYNYDVETNRIKSEFRSKGYSSLVNTGRDDLMLLPQSKMRIDNSELNVDGDNNARVIAAKFGKFIKTKRTTRVVLDRFIQHIA